MNLNDHFNFVKVTAMIGIHVERLLNCEFVNDEMLKYVKVTLISNGFSLGNFDFWSRCNLDDQLFQGNPGFFKLIDDF